MHDIIPMLICINITAQRPHNIAFEGAVLDRLY